MGSTQQAFLSTPTFELFRRGLLVQTIQQFHGINCYNSLAMLQPDWAQDLNNVVVSGAGNLSKFRLPVPISVPVPNQNQGPNGFWDFQQGNGLRQVIAQFGQSLYYYTNDLANVTLIESNIQNAGQYDFVSANNILFGTNGTRVQKWIGTLWEAWGIQPGSAPPTVATSSSAALPLVGALFDGTTGYVSTTQTFYGAQVFSWEIWFKTASTNYGVLFECNNAQTGNGGTRRDRTLWMAPNGLLYFGVSDPTRQQICTINSPFPYNDGKWHQAGITLDSNRVATMYVDGAMVATSGGAISPDPLEKFNEYWRIGEGEGGGSPSEHWPFTNAYFSGLISHATFWFNLVRTAAQYATDYSALTSNNQANYETVILAAFPTFALFLTDTSGTTAVDSSSGGSNNGTYQGTVTLNQSATVAGGLSPLFGYEWGYAFMNSTTGHVGNVSPASASTGVLSNVTFVAIAGSTTDPQVDTLVWFRTTDGGGDLFRLAQVNLATGALTTYGINANLSAQAINGLYIQLTDNSPDISLDTTTLGPQINNPPLPGKYLATGQSRVFIANLAGAPQDIIYSGYEQIPLGRPEESFPPYNRLRLSIGAESLAGIGVLHAGVVAFSQTGRMYMMRGAVEDISLAAPVAFTSYLEELPWTLGCLSHTSIRATPYGLFWLAGDKTVQLFDGHNPPTDISQAIYPYLRRITPGTETQAVSGYFNWLERDWYALVVCTDGSLNVNKLFLFAINITRSQGLNTIQSIEAFISDVPAALGNAVTWIGVLTTSKLQRLLCVAANGKIQNLPVSPDTQSGMTSDYTINPATNGNLSAFWRGGYFGTDSPQRSRIWRWLRLVTDQGGFQVTTRHIDDETRTFVNPEILGPDPVLSRNGINRRSKRMCVEINFPAQDAPANVLELQVAQVPTADR